MYMYMLQAKQRTENSQFLLFAKQRTEKWWYLLQVKQRTENGWHQVQVKKRIGNRRICYRPCREQKTEVVSVAGCPEIRKPVVFYKRPSREKKSEYWHVCWKLTREHKFLVSVGSQQRTENGGIWYWKRRYTLRCICSSRAGIFKQSLGARNRGGKELSYRPARLHA